MNGNFHHNSSPGRLYKTWREFLNSVLDIYVTLIPLMLHIVNVSIIAKYIKEMMRYKELKRIRSHGGKKLK